MEFMLASLLLNLCYIGYLLNEILEELTLSRLARLGKISPNN